MDYHALYQSLDQIMEMEPPKVKLLFAIDMAVSARPEKDAEELRDLALNPGWTLNVLILEANLTVEDRAWYLPVAERYSWPKSELKERIGASAHPEESLASTEAACYTEQKEQVQEWKKRSDQDTFYLPRKYLSEPNGRVCDEISGEKSRLGGGIPHRICRYQPRGTGQPGLPASPAEAGRARHFLPGPRRPATPQQRLRGVRPAHRDGSGQPPQYVPDLWRGLFREDAPADGIRRSPGSGGSRSVVHRRFRGHLAGCAGGVPGTAENSDGKGGPVDMLMNSAEYLKTVETIKREIKSAQYKATLHVNRELLLLYHSIGEVINEHKTWGNKFVENLAADIKVSFPGVTGYSVRNLKYMAKFALRFPDRELVQAALAQITWYHHIALLDKVKDPNEHIWYAEQAAQNGWSRNVMVHQIESGLYQRQVLVNKISNFENRLPSPQSELAVQTMKDPYIFDFIPFKEDMVERDIEQALVRDVTKLLLELGTGFAFLGNQYHLNVGGEDFYIDLLFYNLNLRCYVVIELKTGEFKPEYAGQLNFYLSAVDGILKKDQDNPSIGLLLCKSKNDLVAEYSLKDMSKPMGVSAYQVTNNLPEELGKQLPSVEDIQKRIQ